MQLPGRNQSDGTAGSPGNPTGRIRIEAENYNDSLSNGITKEACGDIGGTLDVGYIDAGDSITYDVAAPVSGIYTLNFRLANGGNTSSFQVRNSNGTVLATITVPYTGGWQNYITLPATAMLPAGQQRLQLYCTSNNWNINWLELLPPATGSGGFNGSGAYHIEAEDFIAQNGTLLENCQDAGGTYNIGSINTGDWLDYRVPMPVGGSYQLSVRAASGNSGANTVQLLTATGTVLATLNVSNTGSYQTFSTYTANVSLPAGVQTLRLAVTGGYMAVNWLELAAPNSTVPLDNYALVLNNNFNYTGGMVYEAENTFTVEFMVKPKVAHQIDVESTSGTGGTDGQKYVMFPVQGGSEADSRAGMGISVGTNGVSVYEHADYYMPALLVWAYPIDTVWTHVAVVYHNGKPSLYINGVWKKDGLQSLKQHVYPGTMFPGGYYGSQGDGILDEVRIWSVARTPAQIAANKDGELTGPQTGLVGYWPMNEGTGLVLHDVSGSGRDVDLTSAGYTSASWTNGRYSVASIIGNYRYAFNGKEKDGDIGEDDYDYGARIYDARLGRWFSVDKFYREYINLSPYNFSANSPIFFKDNDGNKITDASGKAITYKEENGVLIFSSNADIYSKLSIAAMYKTNTGKTYLEKLKKDTRSIAFINPPSGWAIDEDGFSDIYGQTEEKKIVDAFISKQKALEDYEAAGTAITKNPLKTLKDVNKYDADLLNYDKKKENYDKALDTYDKLLDAANKWDENKGVTVANDPSADLYIIISYNSHIKGTDVVEKILNGQNFKKAIIASVKGIGDYSTVLNYIDIPNFINTLVEEAFHTQQTEFNYYTPVPIPNTSKFKQGTLIDYKDRKHENDAHAEAKNAENEYRSKQNKPPGG